MQQSDHDKLVLAMSKVLSACGWEVKHNIKGKKRYKVKGNSGNVYFPDNLAKKGFANMIVEIRTRGQRGTGEKVDRGAIQMLYAELEDLVCTLERPKGVMVSAHEADRSAKKLARYFGIPILVFPLDKAEEVLSLDDISEKGEIMRVAKKLFGNKFPF